jgi:hypothetical protein
LDIDRRIHEAEGALENRQIALHGKEVLAGRPVREPQDERGPPCFATEHQNLAARNQFRRQDFRVADSDALNVLREPQTPVLRLDDDGQTISGALGDRRLGRHRFQQRLAGEGRRGSK